MFSHITPISRNFVHEMNFTMNASKSVVCSLGFFAIACQAPNENEKPHCVCLNSYRSLVSKYQQMILKSLTLCSRYTFSQLPPRSGASSTCNCASNLALLPTRIAAIWEKQKKKKEKKRRRKTKERKAKNARRRIVSSPNNLRWRARFRVKRLQRQLVNYVQRSI